MVICSVAFNCVFQVSIFLLTTFKSGADPGFRREGFVHSEGGGGVRTGISGADSSCCRVLGKSTSKKKLQTAVGGGVRSPKNKPVSAHASVSCIAVILLGRVSRLVSLSITGP